MAKAKRKPFRDSKLFQTIKEHAPEALDKVTDIAATIYPPLGAVNAVVDMALGAVSDKSKIPDIKEAHSEYQEDYVEMMKIEAADRNSARIREVAIANAGKFDFMLYISGITALSAFLYVTYSSINGKIPDSPIVHQIVGIIDTVAVAVFMYYFGSSKGSRDKDGKK